MAERERPAIGSVSLRGVTPLLDVLFILLFALLALSETKTANRSELVKILLPEVAPAAEAAATEASHLLLVIDAESRVHVGSEEPAVGSLEELDRALAEVVGDALPEEVAIEIQGDRNARHGVAVGLLQHLRLRGFTRVSLLATGGDDAGFLEGR